MSIPLSEQLKALADTLGQKEANARNYYIIVEAVDTSGDRVKVPISNEETGKTKAVSMWGLRVDRRMFDQMKADKLDDGVIQNSRIGTKRRGYLKPDYNIPTTGATITRW